MGAVTIQRKKVCANCFVPKTFDQFYLRNGKPNGWCKECYSARSYFNTQEKQGHSRFLPLVRAVKELIANEQYMLPQSPAIERIEQELQRLKEQEAI